MVIGNMNSKQPKYNPQPQADWDTYTFEQYINEEADLVAFVTVQKVEDKPKINKDDLDAKLSTLQLDEILFNKLPNTSIKNVLLDQATEFVQPGEKYLMFLTKKGEYFYEIGAEGKIKLNGGEFKTHIKGIEGEYTQEEFAKQFEVKVEELKESNSGN
ncbi:hypothetical protein [Fervidibacillus halotolerans]|uniref:Uncharacterized protein n=1 Tax=Fervidibacillus halotolerans TaxID=2980027 RepID=A0A9E8M2K8_9BACI|nr:hypothetical protein [Fervidibacillus halotolerans]WAA13269.1 hypothetical protein OE105_03870 [Fervidibacillus halotolerans]